jgi:acid phosphatase
MFTGQSLVTLIGGLSLVVAQTSSVKYPSLEEIEAARATVQPYSPVSNVKGLAFDRFVNIWFENTVRLFYRTVLCHALETILTVT